MRGFTRDDMETLRSNKHNSRQVDRWTLNPNRVTAPAARKDKDGLSMEDRKRVAEAKEKLCYGPDIEPEVWDE